MKPIKQTVCIATDETTKKGYHVPEGFIGKYGYFFTPEELNEYTRNVGKTFLEAGAQKATTKNEWEGNTGSEYCDTVVDKQSITNTFEETFNKFEI